MILCPSGSPLTLLCGRLSSSAGESPSHVALCQDVRTSCDYLGMNRTGNRAYEDVTEFRRLSLFELKSIYGNLPTEYLFFASAPSSTIISCYYRPRHHC